MTMAQNRLKLPRGMTTIGQMKPLLESSSRLLLPRLFEKPSWRPSSSTEIKVAIIFPMTFAFLLIMAQSSSALLDL